MINLTRLISIFALLIISFNCAPKQYEEPIISLENYEIEDGFSLEVVASEPFIEAPVTMDFDLEGRMWIVEMKGYMQTLEDTGSEMPNGTISIMEDWDNDGIADHSTVFLDSLILPRAIAHVYDGLLFAAPPNLWFVEIENDKPKNKILVDSLYADGGNVEHQPNGLLMNIDNWIYNANTNFRYQRKNGVWLKEPTTYRGQWGISKDDFGRLYYNNNSVQLIGDYVLPNTSIKNTYYNPKTTVSNVLTDNQRVYPLHRTYVNRGYSEGVLDQDSLLINVTSSCGPLIYRGDSFSNDHYQNAFVCVPEANLVKRNLLSFHKDSINAEQAYDNKEFIASTDAGFRPVNLFNGPDGNMYVVDMHRGVIQHKAFLTPYLQKLLAKHKMDTIIGMGRILKVANADKKTIEIPNLKKLSSRELVEFLKSKNGWIRDKAQHLLVLKKDKKSISLLKEMTIDVQDPISQIHALHSLNGVGSLSFEDVLNVLAKSNSSMVLAHSLVLSEQFATNETLLQMQDVFPQLISKNDSEIDLYLLLALGSWLNISEDRIFPLIHQLSNKYLESKIHQEAIISSLVNYEMNYTTYLEKIVSYDNTSIFSEMLASTIENKINDKKNSIFVQTTTNTDSRTAGYMHYRNICAACHGNEGDGIEGLAPLTL